MMMNAAGSWSAGSSPKIACLFNAGRLSARLLNVGLVNAGRENAGPGDAGRENAGREGGDAGLKTQDV